MKVSLLLCACFAVTCTQLAGCGDPANRSELSPTLASAAPENEENEDTYANAGASGAAATDSDECPDPCAQQTSCGQICLTMKGAGSSCQLVPTANDLTRPPRAVRFDCSQIPRGPDGWDIDAQGHIALMGNTCKALNKGGPHRVALILSCPPS